MYRGIGRKLIEVRPGINFNRECLEAAITRILHRGILNRANDAPISVFFFVPRLISKDHAQISQFPFSIQARARVDRKVEVPAK